MTHLTEMLFLKYRALNHFIGTVTHPLNYKTSACPTHKAQRKKKKAETHLNLCESYQSNF